LLLRSPDPGEETAAMSIVALWRGLHTDLSIRNWFFGHQRWVGPVLEAGSAPVEPSNDYRPHLTPWLQPCVRPSARII
jgi:hypothetical protein